MNQPTDPHDNDPSWIQTFTGRKFWSFDARASDIDIRDIAHALSTKTRYTGHSYFYSVAQHSISVSNRINDSAVTRLNALLHDATEAYLPDIARPHKGRVFIETPDGFVPFSHVENELAAVIYFALMPQGSPKPSDHQDESITEADMRALATERLQLFPTFLPWPSTDHVNPWPSYSVFPIMEPHEAEQQFLSLYNQLLKEAMHQIACHQLLSTGNSST